MSKSFSLYPLLRQERGPCQDQISRWKFFALRKYYNRLTLKLQINDLVCSGSVEDNCCIQAHTCKQKQIKTDDWAICIMNTNRCIGSYVYEICTKSFLHKQIKLLQLIFQGNYALVLCVFTIDFRAHTPYTRYFRVFILI